MISDKGSGLIIWSARAILYGGVNPQHIQVFAQSRESSGVAIRHAGTG